MVFHNLPMIAGSIPRLANEGERCSIGVDLARTVDFTVISVMSKETGDLIHLHRTKDVAWDLQERIIDSIYHKYRPATVILDSSGIGDPMEERLFRRGINVQGLKTNSSVVKNDLIKGLMVAIEHGHIRIPDEHVHPTVSWLWEELRSYTAEPLPTGHIRYSAPPGYHDDGVISLALATHGAHAWLTRPEKRQMTRHDYTNWGDYAKVAAPHGKGRPPMRTFGRHRVHPGIRIRVV